MMAGVQGDLSMPPEPQPVPPPALPQGAGAVPQASQGPQYDFSQGDALRKAAGDPLAQADAMSAERRAVLNPMMNDIQQAGARQQQHSQARQQQLAHNPQSPEPQQGMGLEAAANWVMIATGIGALAGAMTRRSATNAMAAFTGALEGVAAGNKQAFEQNKVIWEQENKRINQQLEQQRDAYMEIMNSDKMDLNMKSLVLQQKALELHDDQGAQIAARKDMQLWAERADKLEIDRQRGVIEYKKIDATLSRYGGAGGNQGRLWDDATVKLKVQQLQSGMPSTQVFRGGRPADIAAVNNAMAEGGTTGGSIAEANKDYAGGMAGARSVGVRAENLKLAIRTADAAIPQALAASDQVWRTGFVPLNKLIQMSQQAGSSPELKAFVGSNIQLAEAWARAMKPTGALDVQLQTRALDYLQTADGPQAYKAAVKTIQQAIQREYGAVQAEQLHQPLPPGELPASAAGATGGGSPAGMSDADLKKKLGL